MGVYLNTFRTEHKTALLNGQLVKVYAYRYLCKAQDIDYWGDWGNPWGKKSARLLRNQCDRAAERFNTLKPVYAADVFEDRWEGAHVYTALPSALHYDTEVLSKQLVGFLTKQSGKWAVVPEYRRESTTNVAGHTFTQRDVYKAIDGHMNSAVESYRCHTNGAEFTREQFNTWRVKAEAEYVAKCEAIQAQRTEQERLAYMARLSLDACAL